MSEKLQKTRARLQSQMLNYYSGDLSHKHNRYHDSHRNHCRTHPIETIHRYEETELEKTSTGLIREFKLKKIRTRNERKRFH
jgi:hypothetical protein